MVSRDAVAYGAGAVLLVALLGLYGLYEPTFIDYSASDEFFLIAGMAWIVGYVNCKGFAWSDNNVSNALFLSSWGLLLGMEFTQIVPETMTTYGPYAAFAAIGIHMASFGLTVIDL